MTQTGSRSYEAGLVEDTEPACEHYCLVEERCVFYSLLQMLPY